MVLYGFYHISLYIYCIYCFVICPFLKKMMADIFHSKCFYNCLLSKRNPLTRSHPATFTSTRVSHQIILLALETAKDDDYVIPTAFIHGSGICTYIENHFFKKKQPNAGVDIPYMDHMGLRIFFWYLPRLGVQNIPNLWHVLFLLVFCVFVVFVIRSQANPIFGVFPRSLCQNWIHP